MPRIIKPARLRPGEVIGVVAPASPMKPELLERGVRYLEGLGYRVKLGRFVQREHGYLAGSDLERSQDLTAMFRDRQVRAIICARGGYGTPRLLHLLDYDVIRRNPKIFVGYSDITALQLAIFRHTGLITFSGPMVAADMGRGLDPFTETQFWRIITEPVPCGDLQPQLERPFAAIRGGHARGRLLGGCLSLLATVAGTAFMPPVKQSIFFLEEIGEEIYRIDRYLVHLRELGVLDRIGGFILGQIIDSEAKNGAPSLGLKDLMQDFIRPLGVPALMNLEYGHGSRKHTLPVGATAELLVNSRQRRVTITEAAVV
ncbi:MAG: LD-carboxypeptidase [candidate division KSB1 bacterium]|nr:LD-carboxypeptidase [candidate division KSB1 bacterium]MDZ7276024.1 LD-carboxypeptidase [candidate division KSB1 bacterium]MDZ7285694.1 LD-carboxypeptidase [candidate division KSB1 bacterium]MDZ7298726.1 LD-carboxypeptidase [candidate division KSB1 bacterium]MDZ7309547.1 LD-carboxypeptidase [candidate division KSB1 bacterium]